MYLKRIEITGFKSFAQKTTLEFEKEISAVVGPNGSGKSNIADAVRWAIGEQSAKALRVKKNENLIFSGHSGGAGRASVSLFFDNRDHKLPIDFEEIVISRRLYKSGETEYFINNGKARLLDILELLARVGINPKSYSVVSQGMADAILRATPEERRGIFEDAAGVKPYKIKRNETIRKLDITEQNLSRVKDLLAEISPRVAFLRRQANKAQKLAAVKAQLEDILKKWYSFSLNRLYEQKKGIILRLDEIDELFKKARKKLDELLQKMDKIKNSSGDLDARQENLRNELENIQTKIDECIKNLAISETKLKIESERKEKIKPEAVAISIDYIKDKVSGIYKSVASLAEKFKLAMQGGNAADDAENVLKTLEKSIEELLEEIASGKAPVDKEAVAKESRHLAEQRAKTAAKLSAEINDFKTKLDGLYLKKNAVRKEISEEVTGDKARRSEFFALQEEINAAENAANKHRDIRQSIIIDEAKINTRIEDLSNEIKAELNGASAEEIRKIKTEISDEKETKSKIDKLKREYIQIGGIDPAVIEEYKETEERFDFLSKESGDLEKAVSDLKKVIGRLDEKIEDQFNSVFKKINFEFNKYFRMIFGGGGATLEIFDLTKEDGESGEENQNTEENSDKKVRKREKGVNIKVAIPGKKIKDLEMMSGGERSLTSSAILFAIIASNPPPLVVLDEIDAALDENNSQKIAEILEQISSETQFIVITHNRAMMRKAKTVYGVSMTDESVSRIISVKFDATTQDS